VSTITSRRHEFVQQCRSLASGRTPGDDLVLLDGVHLVGEALDAKVDILRAAVGPRLRSSAEGDAIARRLTRQGVEVSDVSGSAMEAMSPVRTPSGIVAVARLAASSLDRALSGPSPLAVVAVDVQDPGNLGAIIRAAEAGHATGVICAGLSADPFGWKALRGSMGSAFRLPVTGRVPLSTALDAIRRHGIGVAAAGPRNGTSLYDADLTRPLALLVGSEGAGLDADIMRDADLHVMIPMKAPVESLNVAVATAVVVFEAHRQRTAAAARPSRVAPR
jgi:TrmH family RNA methyltransferase